MKKLMLGMLLAVGMPIAVLAQAAGAGTSLGSVTLGRNVMADGKPLAAGTYQVRLTSESPKPGAGQTPESEKYVEFVRGGKVVGREVATVMTAAEVKETADSKRQPAAGASRVELLKGDDYLRVWINRGGMNYLIHLVTAAKG